MDILGRTAPREEEKERVEDSAREVGEAKEKGLVSRIIGRELLKSTWEAQWKRLILQLEPE